ncbi:MAG TPA: DUF6454 family protein [Vicinamibacterales bacterium]
MRKPIPIVLLLLAVAFVTPRASRGDEPATVGDLVLALTRDTSWRHVRSIRLSFDTHHPQGLVRAGDVFLISSVEVRRPTRRYPQPVDGRDRDTGEGVGHLFKADSAGRLLAGVTLGEGAVYHPGGIDYDGMYVWVPVAEYRPDSRSIVYRVNPETLRAEEVLRVDDHIGAVVHDIDGRALHGVSWGSRRFYRWALREGRVGDGVRPSEPSPNPSHYVDYQDCRYAGKRRMLCTGIATLRQSPDATRFVLGGIDLVSLEDGRPVHQVPLPLWTADGLNMARNPVWFEADGKTLRGYFMPEDDESTIYVYEAAIGSR